MRDTKLECMNKLCLSYANEKSDPHIQFAALHFCEMKTFCLMIMMMPKCLVCEEVKSILDLKEALSVSQKGKLYTGNLI